MSVKVHKEVSWHSVLEDSRSGTLTDGVDTTKFEVTRDRVLDLESCLEVVSERRK